MSNILRLLAALLTLPFFAAAQMVDTVPPQLKCKDLPYIDAGTFLCRRDIYALDFVNSVTDDVSAMSAISLGVRKKCTGDGFPDDKNHVTFFTTELGHATVELWAKDQAGNASSCQTQVEVVDYSGNCHPEVMIVAHAIKDSSHAKINGVLGDIVKITCSNDSIYRTTKFPYYEIWDFFRPGDYLTVMPSKTDYPLNGVSTYDLVLISKHILGLGKLSAAQLIAADANRDGKVTTYDIVLLRQLILGIIPELPGGVSWRFWPYDYAFPDPDNPFAPPFPERIEVPRSADPVPKRFEFFGVKIGDVNFSAEVN